MLIDTGRNSEERGVVGQPGLGSDWERPRGLLEGSILLLLVLPGNLPSHPSRGAMVTPFEGDPQPKAGGTVSLRKSFEAAPRMASWSSEDMVDTRGSGLGHRRVLMVKMWRLAWSHRGICDCFPCSFSVPGSWCQSSSSLSNESLWGADQNERFVVTRSVYSGPLPCSVYQVDENRR